MYVSLAPCLQEWVIRAWDGLSYKMVLSGYGYFSPGVPVSYREGAHGTVPPQCGQLGLGSTHSPDVSTMGWRVPRGLGRGGR